MDSTQPDTDRHPPDPGPPPLTARLRLVFGYLVILLAFIANGRNLAALPRDMSAAETLREVFVWWALVPIAIGGLIRMWSAGTLLKTAELATEGPYALSRNPLYFGSFVAGLGLCTFVHSLPLLALFVVSFVVTYQAQIRWEEKVLVREHAEGFREYVSRVARFVPLRWNAGALHGQFSTGRLVKNKEMSYQVFWLVMVLSLIGQAYLRAEGISISLP